MARLCQPICINETAIFCVLDTFLHSSWILQRIFTMRWTPRWSSTVLRASASAGEPSLTIRRGKHSMCTEGLRLVFRKEKKETKKGKEKSHWFAKRFHANVQKSVERFLRAIMTFGIMQCIVCLGTLGDNSCFSLSGIWPSQSQFNRKNPCRCLSRLHKHPMVRCWLIYDCHMYIDSTYVRRWFGIQLVIRNCSSFLLEQKLDAVFNNGANIFVSCNLFFSIFLVLFGTTVITCELYVNLFAMSHTWNVQK